MAKWDVVVIGAGNGGLSAAVTFAKAGKKVLILEKHNVPGGYATSFKRGRFEFEASLHELSSYGCVQGAGNIRKIFEELGVHDKIEWCRIPDAYRMITLSDPDKIDVTMPFGVSNYIDKMEEYVPGSRQKMEEIFDLCERLTKTAEFLGNINSINANLITEIKDNHMDFVRVAPYSVNDVLKAVGLSKRARDIFNAYWCYLGVDCDTISAIHYLGLVDRYINYGAVCAKGRSHELSCAFQQRFEELGGTIYFNSFVEKIVMDNGAAVGVKVKGRDEIEYADVIVCNSAPHNAVAKMIDPSDLPESAIRQTNARKFAGRGFTMFLGLDKSPEELGIKEHCYMIYDTANTVQQVKSMETIEGNNAQATCCLNNAVPGCSPEGTTILYFTTLYTSDCWSEVNERDYVKAKEYVANRMIDNFEKATGTKIRDSIEEIEIATPATYARYADAPQGTIYGYSAEKWDGIVQRLMMPNSDDFIPNLYFAGGYGAQGLGFGSSYTNGYQTANRIMKKQRKEAEQA